jgi:hypothetical protein
MSAPDGQNANTTPRDQRKRGRDASHDTEKSDDDDLNSEESQNSDEQREATTASGEQTMAEEETMVVDPEDPNNEGEMNNTDGKDELAPYPLGNGTTLPTSKTRDKGQGASDGDVSDARDSPARTRRKLLRCHPPRQLKANELKMATALTLTPKTRQTQQMESTQEKEPLGWKHCLGR